MRFWILLLSCLCWINAINAHAISVETGDDVLDKAFTTLTGKNFSAKAEALQQIIASGHPQANALVEGVLDGTLRVHKKSARLVWVEAQDKKYQATDVFTGKELGLFKSRKLKKITINNALRKQIRAALALRDLTSPGAALRLKAVEVMLNTPDPAHVELIAPYIDQETNAKVREAMELVISLANLKAEDANVRLQTVQSLQENLHPTVRQQLTQIQQNDADPQVQEAARQALEKIEEQVAWFAQLETLFFGLSLGSVLVLAAIGLAITFGVMGVINMAHGELIMLGAYTTYIMQQLMPESIGLSLLLSIPAAFVVSGLVGIAIEQGVIRFLYGRPLETLLATFGISLVLQQLVRTLISPQNVPVANPEFMSGFWQVNGALALTYNRLYIILFCLLVFAALFMLLRRTQLGLQVRAVSQNRAMARAMGVHSARVDALTFGLGSGVAGVAGVALSQLTNVGPNLGQAYIVDSFMVVVFGGVGNLWGTLIGGLSLGVANKFMEPWAGAVMAKILILVFVILFIQKRPRGLFPQKGRAVEG